MTGWNCDTDFETRSVWSPSVDLRRTVPSRGRNPSVSFSQPCLAPDLSAFSGPSSPIFPKPEQTRLHSAFCPQHGWRMNGCFVPGYTKPFVQGHLWVGAGQESRHTQPILPGRLTDSECTQATGQKQRSRWNPGLGAAQEEKRLLLRWAVPRGFTVKCLCHQPQSPLPVSPAPVLYPHPAVWNEKPPLFGVFAIMMKAFFFPFENSSLHSRGGIYHPVPRLQTSASFRSSCPERQPCQTHETGPSGHLDKAQPFG